MQTMKCIECEHFQIVCQPMGKYDAGMAKCKKHDLVVDFMSKQKLNKLVCIEQTGFNGSFGGVPVQVIGD